MFSGPLKDVSCGRMVKLSQNVSVKYEMPGPAKSALAVSPFVLKMFLFTASRVSCMLRESGYAAARLRSAF